MSLKRPLEETTDVAVEENNGEKAIKRIKKDNEDEKITTNDSNNNNNDDERKEDAPAVATKTTAAATTTNPLSMPKSTTKPFGGIFGSASSTMSSFGGGGGGFGTKNNDGKKNNSLGFGAVSASGANSIFGKIDKSGFGTKPAGTATGAFGKVSKDSTSFAAFGSKSPNEKKNSIFTEEVVPVFGSEKTTSRALSPGLTENNVKINGEEDEETVLATRAKLFEMQENEKPATVNATNGSSSGNSTSESDKKDDKGKEKETVKKDNGDDDNNSNNNNNSDNNNKEENDKTEKKDDETAKNASVPAYEWKTRGVGEIRLKEEKWNSSKHSNGHIRNQRLVMRREYGAGSIGGEVILNAQLTSDVKLVRENDSHLRLTSFDTSGKVVTHLIRIKRFKDLEALERKVLNHINECNKKK